MRSNYSDLNSNCLWIVALSFVWDSVWHVSPLLAYSSCYLFARVCVWMYICMCVCVYGWLVLVWFGLAKFGCDGWQRPLWLTTGNRIEWNWREESKVRVRLRESNLQTKRSQIGPLDYNQSNGELYQTRASQSSTPTEQSGRGGEERRGEEERESDARRVREGASESRMGEMG